MRMGWRPRGRTRGAQVKTQFQLPLVSRLTLAATLGGLLFGYDTAVVSGAVDAIQTNFIAPLHLAEFQRDNLTGFVVSSALLGCLIGAILSGWAADRLGRRWGLMISGLFFLISSIGAAIPEIGIAPMGSAGPGTLMAFIGYRVIGGLGVGIASMLSPLYIAEIAPRRYRGRLVSFNQLAIVVGIVLIYFVNWAIALQGSPQWLMRFGWRWMFASEAVPALLFLVTVARIPDSPRWLVMKGRVDEARALLNSLYGRSEAETSFNEILDSLTVRSKRLLSFGPTVVVTGLMLGAFSQAVGINAVTYYAPVMFSDMGASTHAALLQTIFVGLSLTLSTVVTISTVDRIGRKPLLIAGGAVMSLMMAVLGALFQVNDLGLTALCVVLVYIGAYGSSWGPVTWILLSEIFPNSIKARAMSLATLTVWTADLVVTWTFKMLNGNSYLDRHFHHAMPYYAYALLSAAAALFASLAVPETKARSLESIEAHWRKDAGARRQFMNQPPSTLMD